MQCRVDLSGNDFGLLPHLTGGHVDDAPSKGYETVEASLVLLPLLSVVVKGVALRFHGHLCAGVSEVRASDEPPVFIKDAELRSRTRKSVSPD